ncbi:MAG TPA: energy transducer TonB [Flavisolibacter sp.]|nr:energy transducer TonB [Flavisolibacter sp.]
MLLRLFIIAVSCFYITSTNAQTTGLPVSDTFKKMSPDSVETEASVSRDLWIEHLTNFLQPVIEHAAKKGMKKGIYVIQVRFIVEKDGSIKNVEALNNPGFGLGKGAENAVKTGPKWSPGTINGRIVRSYHTQPITFAISEQ